MNVTGQNNTGAGSSALRNNTSGRENTAMGNAALFSNTGNNNTAMGSLALLTEQHGHRQYRHRVCRRAQCDYGE